MIDKSPEKRGFWTEEVKEGLFNLFLAFLGVLFILFIYSETGKALLAVGHL